MPSKVATLRVGSLGEDILVGFRFRKPTIVVVVIKPTTDESRGENLRTRSPLTVERQD
jgi:hypothetical protein